MNIPPWSLRDLEYVSAIDQHLHFANAAKACGVSQPALSMQIRKIEASLGFQLFERSQSGVHPTAKGANAIEAMKRILAEANELMTSSRLPVAPLSGPIRIGSIPTIGPDLWHHLLKPLLRAFPQIKPILREGFTDGLIAKLKAGELDFAILSRTFDESGIAVYPLYREPLWAALPASHSLAKKRKLTPSDLHTSDLLLLDEGHCLRDETIVLCKMDRAEKEEAHAAGLETLRQLVAAGSGIAVFPYLSIANDLARPRGVKELIEYREISSASAEREIALCMRASDHRTKDARELTGFFRSELKKHEKRLGLRFKK